MYIKIEEFLLVCFGYLNCASQLYMPADTANRPHPRACRDRRKPKYLPEALPKPLTPGLQLSVTPGLDSEPVDERSDSPQSRQYGIAGIHSSDDPLKVPEVTVIVPRKKSNASINLLEIPYCPSPLDLNEYTVDGFWLQPLPLLGARVLGEESKIEPDSCRIVTRLLTVALLKQVNDYLSCLGYNEDQIRHDNYGGIAILDRKGNATSCPMYDKPPYHILYVDRKFYVTHARYKVDDTKKP